MSEGDAAAERGRRVVRIRSSCRVVKPSSHGSSKHLISTYEATLLKELLLPGDAQVPKVVPGVFVSQHVQPRKLANCTFARLHVQSAILEPRREIVLNASFFEAAPFRMQHTLVL